MSIEVVHARERMHTEIDWLNSWHSFSFGGHYDPANTHHGLLLVSNDDRVVAGGGFGTHGHRDMEIVTWVLEGALRHRDSTGTDDVIAPGLAQRMSAGSGIQHSEMNASATEGVHFVQMWVPPDRAGLAPGYEQQDVNDRLDAGGLFPLASGGRADGAAITVHQADATLWAGRLSAGDPADVPDAPFVHVFVARGSAVFTAPAREPQALAEGDALRLTSAGAGRVESGADGAEVLMWETYSTVA
jgi:hypothetical protein